MIRLLAFSYQFLSENVRASKRYALEVINQLGPPPKSSCGPMQRSDSRGPGAWAFQCKQRDAWGSADVTRRRCRIGSVFVLPLDHSWFEATAVLFLRNWFHKKREQKQVLLKKKKKQNTY